MLLRISYIVLFLWRSLPLMGSRDHNSPTWKAQENGSKVIFPAEPIIFMDFHVGLFEKPVYLPKIHGENYFETIKCVCVFPPNCREKAILTMLVMYPIIISYPITSR